MQKLFFLTLLFSFFFSIEVNAKENIFGEVSKRVRGLLRNKVKNQNAKEWMATEIAKRKRAPLEKRVAGEKKFLTKFV